MNVFDQPDNFPPVFFHAWEYLKTNGPTHREELEKQLAPSSFAPTAHANVKSTLKLGIRTHVFKADSEVLSNSDRTNSSADFNSFRRVVRDIFFDQKLNNQKDIENQKGNIQIATAWFLSFPFEQTPATWKQAEKVLPKDFSNERSHWPIQNHTQWTGFERWMRFLGLGIQGIGRGDLLILQPCINELVFDALHHLPTGSRTSIRSFLDVLTSKLPSLPGGTVFADLPSGVTDRIKTRNTSLVAQALRDLAMAEVIKLESGVDVASREVFAIDAGEFNFDFIVKENKK
jgi:hypothetical protein